MITYLPVPEVCRSFIATVHFGNMPAGFSKGPIVVPQIWVCTTPVWWLGTESLAAVRLPPVALIGPTSQAVAVHMGVGVRFPGCGLTARGWSELVGLPASEMLDTTMDCSLLWREPCDRLLQELAAARSPEQENAAMLDFACRISQCAGRNVDLTRIQTMNAWLAGASSVDTLVESMGLSHRQVNRIVLQTYGLSPKHLFAKHRAMRAAGRSAVVQAGSPEVWREYADQSHCIREFRRFLGTTPRGYLSDETAELARATVAST